MERFDCRAQIVLQNRWNLHTSPHGRLKAKPDSLPILRSFQSLEQIYVVHNLELIIYSVSAIIHTDRFKRIHWWKILRKFAESLL